MLNFILQRLARIALILVGVELLVFLLIHIVPGSPWDTPSNQLDTRRNLQNSYIDTGTMARLNSYYGLDLPLWRQFTRYFIGDISSDGSFKCGVICGNLGPSIRQGGRTVQDILFQPPEGQGPWNSRVGYTLRLVSYAFAIVTLLGLPLGVASAFHAKSWFDKTVSTILTAIASIPIFVLGLLSILIFASGLKWIKILPDWSQPRYWIIPTVLLVMIPLTSMVRLTRSAMLNAMSGDYIRTARVPRD